MSLWYSVKEGISGFRRARFASAVTVFTVSFALVVMGVVLIVAVNLGRLVLELRARVEIEVFLDPNLSDQDAQKLEERIKAVTGVGEVQFVSKERAALEFRETFGDDVMAILQENPLPASFRIRPLPEYRTAQGVASIVGPLAELEGVDEVVYRGDVLRFLDRYTRLAVVIGFAVSLVLVVGALMLVGNTIRLAIMARSDVIEIMQLVGATRAFVRRPFVIQGTLEGLMAGVLGAGALRLLVWLAGLEIPNLVVVDGRFYFGVVIAGGVLGWIGSALAVRKYLK